MFRFRFYFDTDINMTHVEKHSISEEEIFEFFNEITIWTYERGDGSNKAIGKLHSKRYITVVYRKLSKYDYFIITAYDISENYIKEFIDNNLEDK